MRKFKFSYTLRNGQTGTGLIEAPNYESVGMMARGLSYPGKDARIYDVEEVPDESKDTDNR